MGHSSPMEEYSERVAAVFGGLEPALASKAPSGNEQPLEFAREKISHRHDDQHVYVPPAKRSRSESDDRRDRRVQRSREHDEKAGGRSRYRRHGEGSSHRSRRGRAPDYVKNPSKWTKYDLKDDGSEVLRGMNQDQVNKYAAFQFLDEVKKRKTSTGLQQDADADSDISTDHELEAKVVFKRPVKNPNRFVKQAGSEDSMVDDASNRRAGVGFSGGIKMAEYVVGSKTAAQHTERKSKRK